MYSNSDSAIQTGPEKKALILETNFEDCYFGKVAHLIQDTKTFESKLKHISTKKKPPLNTKALARNSKLIINYVIIN